MCNLPDTVLSPFQQIKQNAIVFMQAVRVDAKFPPASWASAAVSEGLLKKKEEFLRREQEGQKEKRGIFESHSKEVIALRQEIKGLKIIKQRKEVLEADKHVAEQLRKKCPEREGEHVWGVGSSFWCFQENRRESQTRCSAQS